VDHGVHIGRAGGPPTEGRRAQYCFNQLEILDDTIEQVVYEHVFPQKVLPLIYRKLSTWHVEPHQTTMESYVSLRWCVELTPPEFDRFVQECVGVLANDRAFWIPASYHQGHRWGGGDTGGPDTVRKRVQDLAFQYIWHVPMDRMFACAEVLCPVVT
jgi:hypothetical protein